MTTRRFATQFGEHTGADHARPWVWFMIDSFLLVTQFFVITFHVRNNDPVIPLDLAKCGPDGIRVPPRPTTAQIMRVHVRRDGTNLVYQYNAQPNTLAALETSLATLRQAGRELKLRVSYDGEVPYGSVMAVFNICQRVGIAECGLVPLR